MRKPRLCEPGQLTRAQYQAKIAELRAAVTAGDIIQAQSIATTPSWSRA